jgi:translation initiation factor IF-2
MSIRAYKIAEELGIDRTEFVEKAAEVGVELKNAMAAVDEATADELREKLGAKKREAVTEARVERRGGAVIRRRKKVEPEPEPEPELAPEPETPIEEVASEVDPAADPEDSEEPTEAPPEEPEEIEEAPEEPTPAEAEPQPIAARQGGDDAAGRPARSTGAPRDEAAAAAKTRKQFKEVVNLREQEQIARQVTSRSSGRTGPPAVDSRTIQNPRKRRRDAPAKRAAKAAPAKAEAKFVRVDGEISVGELAKQLGAKAAQVQGKLMSMGKMVTVNQTIDFGTAEQVALEYGFETQNTGFQEDTFLDAPAVEEGTENLHSRPPIVTVMGHVDHGKTSLLDALRKSNVVDGEAGGITQHIGAYQVDVDGHTITFIDTPGHAAFTAMRARGAQCTDVVILVVAASEGIMPQTIEAIQHAQAAGVPIVVAVNKIDLPGADSQSTRQRLMEHNVVVEDFGGDVLAIDVSATEGTGLDKLLEGLVLQGELLEPKADPTLRAKGVVLEAQLEKGRGPVATMLVQEGTLRRGDIVVCGVHWGRVRTMSNERGENMKEALPSAPVQLVGLSGVPAAGDEMHVVESDRVAKEIISHREDQERNKQSGPARPRISLEDLFAQAEGGGVRELGVVIKADTQGSAEAVKGSLEKLTTDRVKLNVLVAGVGGVSEGDVTFAEASNAIILGFHVRPDAKARRAAESAGVEIRSYQIIYELIDDVRAAMAGLLPPTRTEVVLGNAEVRETFTIPKVGTIAGSYVTDGLMRRNAQCRLVRDGTQVFEGQLASLKRHKDDAREVQTGFECGIGIEAFNDIKVGDVIEAFEIEEKPAEL